MSYGLDRHPWFTKWVDPETGVESFILTRRVAPLQKTFYCTRPGIAGDSRWLWFYAGCPPSIQWQVGVVSLDPDTPRIHVFPGVFAGGTPLVTAAGDSVYVPIDDGIYLLNIGGDLQEVVRMPEEIIQRRHMFRLVTDLTVSADGKYFALDSQIGNRWLISIAEVATGKVTPLRWFGVDHSQVQFSPVDPNLILVAQGPWVDPITGDKFDMNVRMWLMDTKLTRYEPVFGDLWYDHNSKNCPEWWTASGWLSWCDRDSGVYECNLADKKKALVWSCSLTHGQCDPTRRYYCGDRDPHRWSKDVPCRVFFYDRHAMREIVVASRLPVPPLPARDLRAYHVDPHPSFSADGKYLVYTTTVLGSVDVAVAPVEGITEKLWASAK